MSASAVARNDPEAIGAYGEDGEEEPALAGSLKAYPVAKAYPDSQSRCDPRATAWKLCLVVPALTFGLVFIMSRAAVKESVENSQTAASEIQKPSDVEIQKPSDIEIPKLQCSNVAELTDCSCEGHPIGSMTKGLDLAHDSHLAQAFKLSPKLGSATSFWEFSAFAAGREQSLASFRCKAALVVNVASA
eukprot:TRINITY_DN63772_c0_g1_i1.p1 TRINITY_DN63772_c0_g1~~TRINITY_DN63772_c0_g1_i1.p1  ORF type:complete len:189 (-),score=32.07 TRINITY_DN63772_c0_g1_i1:350-916(-)